MQLQYLPNLTEAIAGSNDFRCYFDPKNTSNNQVAWYQKAPRQRTKMPVGVNGPLKDVSGPYRNVPDPSYVYGGGVFPAPQPGFGFSCTSNADIRKMLLDVNIKNPKLGDSNDALGLKGKIKSDMAGFVYPRPQSGQACNEYVPGSTTMCREPETLLNETTYNPRNAQVDHIVPATDKRGCPWGDNSTKNAAIISAQLNVFLSNNMPTAEVLDLVQPTASYVP